MFGDLFSGWRRKPPPKWRKRKHVAWQQIPLAGCWCSAGQDLAAREYWLKIFERMSQNHSKPTTSIYQIYKLFWGENEGPFCLTHPRIISTQGSPTSALQIFSSLNIFKLFGWEGSLGFEFCSCGAPWVGLELTALIHPYPIILDFLMGQMVCVLC